MNSAPAERPEAPGQDAPPAQTIAIVVAYNSARDLRGCLESLESQRGAHLEVHVVDNASVDGSADLVRREFPKVRITPNERNVGFARANNQILEQTDASFYVLANPDTVAPPGAVATCIDYLKGHPAAGLVATRLVGADGVLQPSCHSFLDLSNLFGEALGLHRLLPGMRRFASLHMPWFGHDRVAEVDWIQGAFLVVRGDVVRRVGALDPDFFMYGEEMDWCRRIRAAGWTVVFLPEPSVVHAGGASSAPVAGPMFVENLKGRVRYLRKHRGPAVAALARALIAVSVFLRAARVEGEGVYAGLRGRARDEAWRRKRRMFRAAMRWALRGLPLEPYGGT